MKANTLQYKKYRFKHFHQNWITIMEYNPNKFAEQLMTYVELHAFPSENS